MFVHYLFTIIYYLKGDRVIIAGEHLFRFNHPLESGAGHFKRGQPNNFKFAPEEYIKAQTARWRREREREGRGRKRHTCRRKREGTEVFANFLY